jgi:hypothetical protein
MLDGVPLLARVKTIFVPSGDQPGSRQLIDLASENAPPHEVSWKRPTRLKRGARLKLLASISSGGVKRARAFVVRAP